MGREGHALHRPVLVEPRGGADGDDLVAAVGRAHNHLPRRPDLAAQRAGKRQLVEGERLAGRRAHRICVGDEFQRLVALSPEARTGFAVVADRRPLRVEKAEPFGNSVKDRIQPASARCQIPLQPPL